MSTPTTHLDPHGASPDEGPHITSRGYLIGFVASVILTAIPFWLVMTGALSSMVATAIVIFGLALVQVIVHVVFFLHLDARSEGGWTLIAFIFTAVIVIIAIAGSIWIMYHLDANMMPMPPGAISPGM